MPLESICLKVVNAVRFYLGVGFHPCVISWNGDPAATSCPEPLPRWHFRVASGPEPLRRRHNYVLISRWRRAGTELCRAGAQPAAAPGKVVGPELENHTKTDSWKRRERH